MAGKQYDLSSHLSHFLAIPWCAERLQEPGTEVILPPGRTTRDDNDARIVEEELWATTLNTPETFAAFVAFYRRPPSPAALMDRVEALAAAGRGLAGFPGMMHGGIVATLLDGIAGLVPGVNQQRGALAGTRFVTGYLNTTYSRPVPVPGVVLLTASLVRREGRKLFVEATVQDDKGAVLSKADVLFIETRGRSKL